MNQNQNPNQNLNRDRNSSGSGSENISNFFVYDYNHKAPYNGFKVTNYLELVPEHFSKVIILRNRAELANYHYIEEYNYFEKSDYNVEGKWNNYGYGPRFYVPILAVYRSQKWRNENLYEGSFSPFPRFIPDPESEELIDVAIEMEKHREFINSRAFYDVDGGDYNEEYDGDEVYVVHTEKLSDWNQKELAPYCQCDYHRCWYWNPFKFLYNTVFCGCIQEFDNKMPPQEVINSTRSARDEALKKEKKEGKLKTE